jgi:spermidine/putrescine transport system substrate-binding protein
MTRRTLFFCALTGLAGCRRSSQPRLNVYNWSNYIGPKTLEQFEKQTGIRIRYGIFESSDELLAKALTGNCGWDVVFPTNHHIAPLRDYNLLAPLDHSLLTNLKNLADGFRQPEWDPQLHHSVPYMSTSAGIVYNRKQLGTITRWADLWDQKVAGRLTMLDAQDDVLGACLRKLGHDWNSTNEGELRAAQQEAIRQKPLLRAYLNAEVRDQVVAGDVLAAQMWTTTMMPVMNEAPQLEFVYPAEGFVRYAESAVILRESPRAEAGHRFINFLLDPEVAAACVIAEKTGPVLSGVRDLLPANLRDQTLLFPGPAELARAVWLRTMPPAAQRLRDRLWTEIKSA